MRFVCHILTFSALLRCFSTPFSNFQLLIHINGIAGYFEKQANCLIDSDGCMGLSDYNVYEWFKFVSPIAECIVDGYIPANLDVRNIETVDCKKQLNASKLSSLYKTYLKSSGGFLSDVPVSVYKDACCVAKLVNDIVQIVIENTPELFRGFKESCIIPDGIRVYDYMRELS